MTLPGTQVIDGVIYEPEVVSDAKDLVYEVLHDLLSTASRAGSDDPPKDFDLRITNLAANEASDLVDVLRKQGWTHPNL